MKNKTSNTNTNTMSLFNRIAASKGRFFGLYLKSGETVNAQFRSLTNSYLTVYDRTEGVNRRFRRTSVSRATV